MSVIARNDRSSPPWVLIAAGFHHEGGMDKANAALASYLCREQIPVHLVGFRIDRELAANPAVTVHYVRKPAGSFFLGNRLLSRVGTAVAQAVVADNEAARVVVNGDNCDWPAVNWVHFVHRAWCPTLTGTPIWFQAKSQLNSWITLRRERQILQKAKLLLANSERTRRDLVVSLGLAPERVHTVYLGTDSNWKNATPERRAQAEAWLDMPGGRPLVTFIGALGHDSRKGFDTLWTAWRSLCSRPAWDVNLVVAGGGRALTRWQRIVNEAGLDSRVKLLGFTNRVADLLIASDLLVSPVRYESYGLNVQEALCFGVPAMVTVSAGVAERYPVDLGDLLLPEPAKAEDLAMRLLRWRSNIEEFRRRTAPVARLLRAYDWDHMARRIVALVERTQSL